MEGVQAVRAGASLKVLSVNELDGTAQSTRSPETTAVNG
jgi:hypothetical protein